MIIQTLIFLLENNYITNLKNCYDYFTNLGAL